MLEYRVAVEGASDSRTRGLGARTRAIPIERPGEWPIDLEAGMTIDLLTGEVGGERAHVEVVRAGPMSVQLRPLEGVTLTAAPTRSDTSWVVPETYGVGVRSAMFGSELVARLPERVYVRLLFLGEPQENARMLRQLDPWGGRVLPRAPELPVTSWSDGRVRLAFSPLDATVEDAGFAVLVVEREKGYGTDDWDEVLTGAASETEIEIAESARRVCVTAIATGSPAVSLLFPARRRA